MRFKDKQHLCLDCLGQIQKDNNCNCGRIKCEFCQSLMLEGIGDYGKYYYCPNEMCLNEVEEYFYEK